MIALLKIEWIKMIRTWMTFVLFIVLPVFFFLLFSGMEFSSNNQEQQSYITSYMLTMTAFSMSSFIVFRIITVIKSFVFSIWVINFTIKIPTINDACGKYCFSWFSDSWWFLNAN